MSMTTTTRAQATSLGFTRRKLLAKDVLTPLKHCSLPKVPIQKSRSKLRGPLWKDQACPNWQCSSSGQAFVMLVRRGKNTARKDERSSLFPWHDGNSPPIHYRRCLLKHSSFRPKLVLRKDSMSTIQSRLILKTSRDRMLGSHSASDHSK